MYFHIFILIVAVDVPNSMEIPVNHILPLLFSASVTKLPLSFPSFGLLRPGISALGLVQPEKFRGVSLDLASPRQREATWEIPCPINSTHPFATKVMLSTGSSHWDWVPTLWLPQRIMVIHTTQMQVESNKVRLSNIEWTLP